MFRETLSTNASALFEYEGAEAELKHLKAKAISSPPVKY
jgi:hypothetical protein